ncbi:MAG: OsmC family protein [Actinobacteria bacterium]|jgi:organic hydroperoxide reductase OsmC/OhrA|nr:MAG: OsmC family protein [Actinomycetota bacterium]
MNTLKDFRFRVEAAPLTRGRVRLTSDGKAPLEAAIPAEFRGGTPGMWSPEDLLVAAVTSCYVVTLRGVAEHRGLAILGLNVEGVGHVTRRAEGRIGFVVIELRVDLTVDPASIEQAERAARAAKQRCLVGHALDVPIELELQVRGADLVQPALAV